MTRATTGILLALLLALFAGGCDWYGLDEVALRPLPYPYDAGVAVDHGGAPSCLEERGVTFIFDGEEVGTAGQDAACSLVDRGRQLWESMVFLASERKWRTGSFLSNKLFEPRVSSDGTTAYAYKKYTGQITDLPARMPADVVTQVADKVAYELKAKNGIAILAGRSSGRHGPPAPVTSHLRLEHQRGGIYYAERDRLLAYSFVRRYLDWSAVQTDSSVAIDVRAVDDQVGEAWAPSAAELAGITFYTPDPERTRVLVAGKELNDVTVNPPDWTRRGSVTIGSTPTRPPDST